jgi:tetratricopeptide (TPR) repeat protein
VLRLIRREIILLILLLALAVIAYLGTRALANSNRSLKEKIAATWFREGQRELRQGRANDAVAAFRKAAVNDYTSRVYLLSLATALQAAQRSSEARDLLLQVREAIPENPGVNLALARISASQRNVSEALRYYHNALFGIWTGDDVDARRQAIRRELIEFLVAQNAKEQALAETVALAAHLPGTPAAHLQLGSLFLSVDDATSALQNFTWVLHHDPQNQTALRGAGESAFKTSNYSQARRLLNALSDPDPKAKEMLETAKVVLENDPFAQRLSERERIRRTSNNIDIVKRRVEQCVTRPVSAAAVTQLQGILDKLTTQKQLLIDAEKHPDPNVLFSSVEFIYDAENLIAATCGPLNLQDNALLLMAQKNRGAEQ